MLLALAVAGCGGGDDENAKRSDTLANESTKIGLDDKEASKADRMAYISKADKICRRYNRDIAETNAELQRTLRRERKRTSSIEDFLPTLADLLYQAAGIAEESRSDFDELKVPKNDEDVIDGFLNVTDRQIKLLNDAAESAQLSDALGFESIGKDLKKVNIQRDELAAEYGFKDCGRKKKRSTA